MKTKLLRKVRKRFTITHLPDGFIYDGIRFEYNLFRLTDSTNGYFERYSQFGLKEGDKQFCEDSRIFETKKECISTLQEEIIYVLRKEGYVSSKDRKRRSIKVY